MSDSTYQWVRIAVYVIGIPIIIYLCRRIVQRVRDIRALDTRLRAEEKAQLDAALRGDTPINPYADMAALYGYSAEEKTKEEKSVPVQKSGRRQK